MSYQSKCEELYIKHDILKREYNILLTKYEKELSFRRGLTEEKELEILDILEAPIEDRAERIQALKLKIQNFRCEKVVLLAEEEAIRKEIGDHYLDRAKKGQITSLTIKIKRGEKDLEDLTFNH